MDRLVYTAMTGAKQAMLAQSLVSNNLANANTYGFRADLARFSESPVQGPGMPTRVDSIASGMGFDHSTGTLVETGRPLDVAVDGTGWIAVQAEDGTEAYTRSGALNIDALGLLRTRSGELVLGDNGPIAIPPFTQFMIGGDGRISVVPQGQGPETMAQAGRIKLVNPDLANVLKRPDGLVGLGDGEIAPADASVKVFSGVLETSNVNLGRAMIEMIELSRRFEIEVRMMRVADENASAAAELLRNS
ncbi:MAG: flagellar basal-body rod protein FlgF [Gammaproteobacteria bacterium]|nr:flagellar basal-body rod protein FlgF [Gammaproteobacteria bacterium]